MALPIVDISVTMSVASKNVIAYIKDTDGVERIFKIEQMKVYINTHCNPARTSYLLYILRQYQ